MSGFDWFNWLILPLLIFFSRILDVSIGTLRIVFISRNQKIIAPILGFFEVFIWLIAISQIMQNLNNFMCYFAYAAGFASGTYIGLKIEEKLALGILMVRIITQKDSSELAESLRQNHFGVTEVPAEGLSGKVNILITLIQRSNMDKVVDLIDKYNPNAFYSVENVKATNQGIFPQKYRRKGFYLRRVVRKGK